MGCLPVYQLSKEKIAHPDPLPDLKLLVLWKLKIEAKTSSHFITENCKVLCEDAALILNIHT